jgi:hypothetical protein
MSDLQLSKEKLLDTSSHWTDLPSKSSTKDEINTLIGAIRVLEDGIKSMLQKGYTYKDVAGKLQESFQIEISPQTLSSYLATIKKERKKSLLLSKRESRRVAKASSPSAKEGDTVKPEDLSVDMQIDSTMYKQVEPTVSEDDHVITRSTNQKSTDEAIPTKASTNLKPSKNEQAAKSKSLVPKLNKVDSPLDASDDEDETERRRQAETLKHFNKY